MDLLEFDRPVSAPFADRLLAGADEASPAGDHALASGNAREREQFSHKSRPAIVFRL
jgi:hypothetical protein